MFKFKGLKYFGAFLLWIKSKLLYCVELKHKNIMKEMPDKITLLALKKTIIESDVTDVKEVIKLIDNLLKIIEIQKN